MKHGYLRSKYIDPPSSTAPDTLAPHAAAFEAFGRSVAEAEDAEIAQATTTLLTATGTPVDPTSTSTREKLKDVLEHIEAPSALRLACTKENEDKDEQRIVPKAPKELASKLFRNNPGQTAINAVDGLLTALSYARDASNNAPLQMRAHLMFRNLQGLWACTNPKCSHVRVKRTNSCLVGALHYVPTLSCQCDSRVLELLYCQPCGEIFFGGYRRETGTNNEWYLSPDHPDLEAAPDLSSVDRNHDQYAVFWPTSGNQKPIKKQWTQGDIKHEWKPASFRPTDGRLGLNRLPKEVHGYLYVISSTKKTNAPALPSGHEAFPSICPRCEADWRDRSPARAQRTSRQGMAKKEGRRNRSPIRTQRTGFQRLAQVLSDTLLRDLKKPPLCSKRKLVVFSDSRQDAAKLSADMRNAHYRDSLRQALVISLDQQGMGLLAFAARCRGEELSRKEQEAASAFRRTNPDDASVLSMGLGTAMDTDPYDRDPRLTNRQAAQMLLQQATSGLFRLNQIEKGVAESMLDEGMNPAGHTQNVKWTNRQKREGDWKNLYDWPDNSTPARKPSSELDQAQEDHLMRIRSETLKGLVDIVFDSGRRNFESLLLGLPTFDRLSTPAKNSLVQEGADGTIFLLGIRKRFTTTHGRQAQSKLPRYVTDYLETIARQNGLQDSETYISDVTDLLESSGILDTNHYYLDVSELYLTKTSTTYFECTQCRRIHMNPSGGICAECYSQLGPGQSITSPLRPSDYYSYLANEAGGIFRLNCEELTGQTDKPDARDRQRLFQDIYLSKMQENSLVDPVDLLSVTTTMEAGVDIGTLVGVMMANMPPMRFNYQQRVGRAGRRGSGMSLALTLCRGRSHDDYYFQRPDLITSGTPPQPYLDMKRENITRRVLAKEVLRRAFEDLKRKARSEDNFITQIGDSVHGEFGSIDEWEKMPPVPPAGSALGHTTEQLVSDWLQKNPKEIDHIIDVLLSYSDPDLKSRRQELVDYCKHELVQKITEKCDRSPYTKDTPLSSLLANAGILPMFGFPTRVRHLFHYQPRATRPWPPRGVIDRDLDLAISQFAPGAEIVKDGLVYTSVGVVGYQPKDMEVKEVLNPLGPQIRVGICSACQAVDDSETLPETCSACGATNKQGYRITNLSQPAGFRTQYDGGRDYDGRVEWMPYASRPKMGIAPLRLTKQANFEVGTDQGTVYIINDNHGRLFKFEKLAQGEAWVTSESYIDNAPTVSGGSIDERALASVKTTDVMVFGIVDWPAGIRISPVGDKGLGTRAALYSFGFLARRAAIDKLDIDAREIKVGLRVIPGTGIGSNITGQIFISDDLENGAGYATLLGKPAETEDLLQYMVGKSGPDFHKILVSPDHLGSGPTACTTSCPDCMRDYNNLSYHSILDWRLGLDLARLALDANARIDFSVDYWQGLDEVAARSYFAALHGWQQNTFGGLQAGHNGSQAKIITHPLWDCDLNNLHPELAKAYAQAKAVGYEVEFKSIFEVLRRTS